MNLNVCNKCNVGCLKITTHDKKPQTLTCSRIDYYKNVFILPLSKKLEKYMLKHAEIFKTMCFNGGLTEYKYLIINDKIEEINSELIDIELNDCPYYIEHKISNWNGE